MISGLWLLVIVGALTLFWLKRKPQKKGKKEIPGPWGLPFLGSALQLGKKPHFKFNEWTKKYGEIYQVKLGSALMIIITNRKMLKEMFLNDPNFVGRPRIDAFKEIEDADLGLINVEGELWEANRRFCLRQLRDFGFGKAAMESLIMEEIKEIVHKFKANEGKPITDMKKLFSVSVINALWVVVGGERYQHDDPHLNKLIENTQKAIGDAAESGGLVFAIPWLRHIMPEWSGWNSFVRLMDDIKLFFRTRVEEHKKNLQEDDLRDFIDVYLAEIKKTTDPNSPFYGDRAERQLTMAIADLFFAGSDTTSTTLAWAILYLCLHPKIQEKFQEEIASVTNNSRSVSVTDRPNMPYTVALIDEILRYSSMVPTGVQHRAIEDKEVNGYFFPKDSWISPNMYFLHHDPAVWGDPEVFRPERFLSADGKKYEKNENLIPFQIGRRQCLGETLARDTLFLFLTNVFQRFTVSLDPNSPPADTVPEVGFMLNPKPYSIIVKDRVQ